MQGIEVLLGTEVWPWISHTVTFGVVAGGVYTLGQIAFRKWRELPLIEHRIVHTSAANKVTEVAITVIVFNRAPDTMLRLENLIIDRPKEGVLFGDHSGNRGRVYLCGKDIPPAAPGASQFPSTSVRAVVAEWPSAGADAEIRVSIRSKSKWMIFSQRTVSIKLPSTV
jgi:hypothetical protein